MWVHIQWYKQAPLPAAIGIIRTRTTLDYVDMTTQTVVTQYDQTIAAKAREAVSGLYRIRLDNIEVGSIPRSRVQNVQRLTKIFRDQRCFRRDVRNYIVASINADILENHTSTRRSSDGATELLLRSEDHVQCLHGSCRIVAAKAVLYGSDRWWMVRLYKHTLGRPTGHDVARTLICLKMVGAKNIFERLSPTSSGLLMALFILTCRKASARGIPWQQTGGGLI